jgi:hypothetical protein
MNRTDAAVHRIVADALPSSNASSGLGFDSESGALRAAEVVSPEVISPGPVGEISPSFVIAGSR